jgi:antitoxin (DNA-binding transcriptional repressor) of toxin-antitoxin stability system
VASLSDLLPTTHVDEPQQAQEYALVLSRVAEGGQTVIVRRGGTDLAAIVPLEHLEILREELARRECERLAKEMDWDRIIKESAPLTEWLEGDEPIPF